jgi:hypothetical protein
MSPSFRRGPQTRGMDGPPRSFRADHEGRGGLHGKLGGAGIGRYDLAPAPFRVRSSAQDEVTDTY